MKYTNRGQHLDARSRRADLNPYYVEVLALTPEELERVRSNDVVLRRSRSSDASF